MEQQGVDATPGSAYAPLRRRTADLADCASGAKTEESWLHADWRLDLRQAIVRRVLPRLSPAVPGLPRSGPASHFTAEVVARFAVTALSTGLRDLLGTVEAFEAAGASLEAIFLDLLSPAARRLGDLWLSDELSFFEVTTGLGRLQALVRALGPDFEGRLGGAGPAGRVLLAPVAGEPHIFGLSIVAAFFRRAGWEVAFEPAGITDAATARISAGAYDLVGLSAAGDSAAARLPVEVAAARRAAGRRGIPILVGGPALLNDPDLGRRAGADATARDATEAVSLGGALQRCRAAA